MPERLTLNGSSECGANNPRDLMTNCFCTLGTQTNAIIPALTTTRSH